MSYINSIDKIINATAVTSAANVVDVRTCEEVSVVVDYTKAGSSMGTLTITGCIDADGNSAYIPRTVLASTGVVSSTGIQSFGSGASEVRAVEVLGATKFINLDWEETQAGAIASVYVIRKEQH